MHQSKSKGLKYTGGEPTNKTQGGFSGITDPTSEAGGISNKQKVGSRKMQKTRVKGSVIPLNPPNPPEIEVGVETRKLIRRLEHGVLLKLEHMIQKFIRNLRSTFPEMKSRPGEFKRQVLTYVRRILPPHSGRPTDPDLDTAQQMRSEGNTFSEIAKALYPTYAAMSAHGRREVRNRLMKALANRRRRNKACTIAGTSPNLLGMK